MSNRLRILSFVAVFAAIGLAVSPAAAMPRGPSTPEERARALQVAKSLRTDPIAADQQDREWLMTWLIEIPDISVKLCPSLYGDLGDSKSGYSGALVATMLASQAAFLIENPTKMKENNAIYLSGLEGGLDGYQGIQKRDKNYHLPLFDELLQKRADGKLADYVRTAAKKCK